MVPKLIRLITRWTSRGHIFPENPEDCPLFFRLLDLNSEHYAAQSCPRVNFEHIPVLSRDSVKSRLHLSYPQVCKESVMALRGVCQAKILVPSAAGNILPLRTALRARTDFSQSNDGLFTEPCQTVNRAMMVSSQSQGVLF